MEISAVLIGLGMLGISMPFVVSPFQPKRQKDHQKPDPRAQNEERRVAALSALRDLDFDYRIGKVSDEDYHPLRAQLVSEAAQHIQEQTDEDRKLEDLIQARRALRQVKCEQCGAPLETGTRFRPQCGAAAGAVCPGCGKAIKAGDLFCSSCGTKMERPAEASA